VIMKLDTLFKRVKLDRDVIGGLMALFEIKPREDTARVIARRLRATADRWDRMADTLRFHGRRK